MYVTLPSNSSTDYYPENTTSDFKTQLPKELDFSDAEWELGVSELILPLTWFNIDSNDFWIFFRRGGVDVRTRVPRGYYQRDSQLVQQLSKTLKQDFELKKQQLAADNTLKRDIKLSFDIKYNKQTQLCDFHINRSQTVSGRYVEDEVALYLSAALANILGFSQREFHDTGVFTAERVVNINAVTAIFVYCDIIQYRIVGHTLAPLLCVVPVGGRSGVQVSKRYDKIQYHPISKTRFATIHISLRDDRGNLIKFQTGKSVVGIHFRRKRFGH